MTQVKERPILFSAPMVRAILEGRKTVTRRPVKGGQIPTEDPAEEGRHRWSAIAQRDPRFGFCVFGSTEEECAKELAEFAPCPYGKPGERLWVRETWGHTHNVNGQNDWPGRPHIAREGDETVTIYRADGPWSWCDDDGFGSDRSYWKPSIHMFRSDSRILLEITDVRVERLQDGDGETAFESRYIAEGINRIHQGDGDYAFHPFKTEPGPGSWTDPFDAWRELWISVSGAESWNANPWIWVVEFKQVTP